MFINSQFSILNSQFPIGNLLAHVVVPLLGCELTLQVIVYLLSHDVRVNQCLGEITVLVGSPDVAHGFIKGEAHYPLVCIDDSHGFDFLLCYTAAHLPPVVGSPLVLLSQALQSPIARTLVLSFLLHSTILFIIGMTGEKIETTGYKGLESRWVEILSQVDERTEEDKKEEEVPVIEDVDDVIIDDALKDMDRPKIDDTQSPIANLDKVEKPVGIQAALGGAKMHDMASLFGTSAGLGDASDFMP